MLSPWFSDLRKIPMLPLTLAVAAGIIFALYVDVNHAHALMSCAGAFLLCTGLLVFAKRVWIGWVAFLLFLMLVGAYRATGVLDRPMRRGIAAVAANSDSVTVMGRVHLPAADSPRRNRITLRSCTVTSDSTRLNLDASCVRLYADSTALSRLQTGDLIYARGRLASGRDLYATTGALVSSVTRRELASVYVDGLSLFTQPAGGHWLRRAVDHFREFSRATFRGRLSPDAAALCNALMLGERGEFSQEFTSQLRLTGLSHIFALSGMNTGLIVLVIWICLSWLPLPHTAKLWILLGATLLYMEVGREAPSLVRASLMAVAVIVGHLLHRKAAFLNLVLAAAFIELLWKPLDLVDPGFLLSYFSVMGLIGGYSVIRAELIKIWKIRVHPAYKSAAGVLAGTVAAQIATLPLVAYIFHRAPLLGALGNVVAVPGFALLLILAICLLLTAVALPFVAAIVASAMNFLAWLLAAAVHVAAALPLASLALPPFSAIVLTALVVAAGLMLVGLGFRQWRWIGVAVLLAGNILVWNRVFTLPATDCTMTFLDVENGDATLISANDHHILVDTGPKYGEWSAAARILPLLHERNIEHLDAIILTHPDNDHIGGTADVMSVMPVLHVYGNGDSSRSRTYLDVMLAVESSGLTLKPLCAGDVICLTDNVSLAVLSPDSEMLCREMLDNRKSLVMRLRAGEVSALLTGDADSTVEHSLECWGSLGDVDLLKCAHHGAKSSTSEAMIAWTTPDIGVISAGERNIFGHPSLEVLERLNRRHVPTVVTAEAGHITFEVRDGRWQRVESKSEELIRKWRLAA